VPWLRGLPGRTAILAFERVVAKKRQAQRRKPTDLLETVRGLEKP